MAIGQLYNQPHPKETRVLTWRFGKPDSYKIDTYLADVWIENGVVKTLAYDRFWAQKQGVAPTRSGGGGFGGPRSLRMVGGTTSTSDMIKSTERGILVTRFWYIRAVDPRTILYTGLTRDGTFLIENGQVTKPVKNFRYNESPIFFLNNLEAIGPAVRVNASENLGAGGATWMPDRKSVV